MTGGQERSLGRGGGDDTVMQPAKINDKQAAGGANPIASGGQAVGTGGGGRGADAMFAAGGAAGGSAKVHQQSSSFCLLLCSKLFHCCSVALYVEVSCYCMFTAVHLGAPRGGRTLLSPS